MAISISVYIYNKSKTHRKICKTLSSSSPAKLFLLSQAQTGATVLLKKTCLILDQLSPWLTQGSKYLSENYISARKIFLSHTIYQHLLHTHLSSYIFALFGLNCHFYVNFSLYISSSFSRFLNRVPLSYFLLRWHRPKFLFSRVGVRDINTPELPRVLLSPFPPPTFSSR